MSGGSCSINYNLKDSKGHVNVSSLWKDLIKVFKGDRKETIIHYFTAKDPKFLRDNSDLLEFDTDGEVTIASLKKALERDGEYSKLSNARTLQHLNDEIKAGEYNYTEALDNVLKFNRSHQFREGFMATLKRKDNGKYEVSVVERNPTTEYELSDHVMNKILTDSIRRILQDRGLSIEFIDNPSYALKYSTNNAHLDADGFMAVAQVLNGINSSRATAEVAGHFLVGAMEDNPLIDRLLATLTQEVQMALFKDRKSSIYRPDFTVSDISAREAAGILIGKQLIEPFEKAKRGKLAATGHFIKSGFGIPKAIKYLLGKIGKFVKSIFGKDTPDSVNVLVQRAKDAAATAAQGFIDSPDIADTNAALATSVTYTGYNITKHMANDVKRSVEAFYSTLGDLKDTVIRLRTSIGRTDNKVNKDIYKKLETLISNLTSEYTPQMSLESFAKNASLEGMVVTLESITQLLDTDVRRLLESIQPSDRAASYANITSNAASMRTLNTALKNMFQMYKTISSKLDSLSSDEIQNFRDKDDNLVGETLRQAVERLGNILEGSDEVYTDMTGKEQKVHGLVTLMELKRRQVFIDAFRDFYGEDFINMNCGKVWQQKGFGKYSLVSVNKKKAISDFIDYLDDDISWFDRYLSAAADCADFVTAVGNKVTRQSNMQADRYAAQFWDRLEELRIQMQEVFGTADCRPLYEYIEDSEGHRTLTGNLISEINYGAWEKARKEFKDELKKGFYNYLAELRQKAYENNKNVPGYSFQLTDMQKGVLYHDYVDNKAPVTWKMWHAEHSEKVKDGVGEKWVPNHTKYHNSQWDALFDTGNPALSAEEKANRTRRVHWYRDLLQVKADMDALLPANATVPRRAPQVTGRFSHRFRNLRAKMNNSLPAFGHALRRNIQDNFIVRPDEAWMFGTNNEFNEIEEDPFENPLYFEKEKINRLPMFGINKLKNMEDLSTDLFGSLTQYGSMAATYNAMSRVVDIFELGKDVLNQRRVGNKMDSERDSKSRAYNRYIKFIDKNVYGLNVTPPSWDRKGTIRKFANTLSSLGGRILLAGNVPGGIVNTGTGMLEILKEATAGENFNMSECLKANQMYYNGLLSTDEYFGTFTNMLTNPQRAMDKNSLWIRHWNILSENKRFLRGQKYDTKAMSLLDNRLWDWFEHTMMLPYSSGDHYMQTIPYYAMGIHEKVYDHDGNRMNLMDAYEVVDGEEVFAIDDPLHAKGSIGTNHKKIRLKEGIFKSPSDIDKYDANQKLVEKIDKFFETHPGIKGNVAVALDILSPEDVKYLQDAKLYTPDMASTLTVKKLETLSNALRLKAKELTYNETNESEFMDKCRNICNRLHGIYNSEDKVAFQQNFYGNLVMSMRGYALGMINRRYAGNRYNVPQGKAVEGSYNTAFKVLMSAFYDIHNADNWRAVGEALLMMTPFSPGQLLMFSNKFGNRLKADMVKAGFSEHQYYNIRRTTADFLVLEALFLMRLLSSPGKHFGLSDDEDDDKKKRNDTSNNRIAGLLYYFTNRWFNEQGAFTMPATMLVEGNSLLDFVPAGASGMGAILDIARLFAQTEYDKSNGQDLSNSTLYYQSSKDGKYEAGDEKWWIKAKRLIPYYRSWYTFNHPYDAAAGYEYGRRIRGK